MVFDNHANFGYAIILIPPVPAISGTNITLAAGGAAVLPAAPFNATLWPTGAAPYFNNAEIVRVTAIVGDTLTISRAQEGSNARAIVAGDQFANTITVKVITDIENAINSIPAAPVLSVFGRTGNVVAQSGDYSAADVGLGSVANALQLIAANNLSDLTDVSAARGNLGGTTVGQNFFTLSNPSAITFPRINVDNTVSSLDAATFRAAIGAGTSSFSGVHNDLTLIQGGAVGEYYHLTSLKNDWLGQDLRATGTPQFERIGVGVSASSTIPLAVGALASVRSVDPQIIVSRNISSGSGNAHCFSDSSNFARAGGAAYASYDARITTSSANNFDHYVGFQTIPEFNSSGTTDNVYGVFSGASISTGVITNAFHYKVNDITGSGSVTNQYGLHVPPLTKGTSKNYGLFIDTNGSRLNGRLGINAEPQAVIPLFVVANPSSPCAVFLTDSDGRGMRVGTTDYVPGGVNGSYLQLSLGAGSGVTTGSMEVRTSGATNAGNLILQPSGGFVGLGMTPTVAFDVSGTIRATAIENTPIGAGTPNSGLFTTLSASLDVSSAGSSVYGSGGALFLGGAGASKGIYTTDTGSPTILFDHRGTGNTGLWQWRYGTGGASTALLLSPSGLQTASPSGGTAQPWKLGNYTAGVAVQAGKVRIEINGTPYDLLTA